MENSTRPHALAPEQQIRCSMASESNLKDTSEWIEHVRAALLMAPRASMDVVKWRVIPPLDENYFDNMKGLAYQLFFSSKGTAVGVGQTEVTAYLKDSKRTGHDQHEGAKITPVALGAESRRLLNTDQRPNYSKNASAKEVFAKAVRKEVETSTRKILEKGSAKEAAVLAAAALLEFVTEKWPEEWVVMNAFGIDNKILQETHLPAAQDFAVPEDLATKFFREMVYIAHNRVALRRYTSLEEARVAVACFCLSRLPMDRMRAAALTTAASNLVSLPCEHIAGMKQIVRAQGVGSMVDASTRMKARAGKRMVNSKLQQPRSAAVQKMQTKGKPSNPRTPSELAPTKTATVSGGIDMFTSIRDTGIKRKAALSPSTSVPRFGREEAATKKKTINSSILFHRTVPPVWHSVRVGYELSVCVSVKGSSNEWVTYTPVPSCKAGKDCLYEKIYKSARISPGKTSAALIEVSTVKESNNAADETTSPSSSAAPIEEFLPPKWLREASSPKYAFEGSMIRRPVAISTRAAPTTATTAASVTAGPAFVGFTPVNFTRIDASRLRGSHCEFGSHCPVPLGGIVLEAALAPKLSNAAPTTTKVPSTLVVETNQRLPFKKRKVQHRLNETVTTHRLPPSENYFIPGSSGLAAVAAATSPVAVPMGSPTHHRLQLKSHFYHTDFCRVRRKRKGFESDIQFVSMASSALAFGGVNCGATSGAINLAKRRKKFLWPEMQQWVDYRLGGG